MPHSKKRYGMVLTEALVAIATLAMGVLALGTITQNSIATTILAKDYLVARGLAKEGEEIVKNIRLTNRMQQPTKPDCWMTPDVAAGCNAMTPNDYFVAYVKNGAWILEDKGSALPNPDLPKVATNIPFQLFTDDSGFYPQPTKPAGTTGSRFYRSIKPTTISADTAAFEIKVQWKDGAKTREINRIVTMYNYL